MDDSADSVAVAVAEWAPRALVSLDDIPVGVTGAAVREGYRHVENDRGVPGHPPCCRQDGVCIPQKPELHHVDDMAGDMLHEDCHHFLILGFRTK